MTILFPILYSAALTYLVWKAFKVMSNGWAVSGSKKYTYKNILSFGDTLHKVHPLAGQGFNMTVRDIKSLTDQIQKNIDLGLELSTAILSFEKERKHNNFFFAYGIDFLHNFFEKENRFKILDNKKISETLDNSFFLKKISEKFANKGFNF